ncbi:hypothetical protein EYF80_057588 [Liparis tanakae]|uniref:Uncharacterized protein n=1 Tax=Liparis tanakae TaxID=230148 RepID=A0A4Z2EUK5_9TELE|nr:hypothetical protein EYF80_057588 [Liparis tanakae]
MGPNTLLLHDWTFMIRL